MSGEEAESAVAGKFDITPLPTFTGEGTISALGGFNLGVSAFSENKEAAKEFVVWASTDPAPQMLMGERSLPPVLAWVYEELSDDPVMAILAEVLPDARPRPPAPSWNAISEAMQQQVFPAYNGQTPVPAAVQAIEQALNEQVGE
jgi:multiple sugar transport system substrate-binding protein